MPMIGFFMSIYETETSLSVIVILNLCYFLVLLKQWA